MVIPAHVLANAKGLAIITVLKAGFLFSGRAGSGVIVARLNDGSWSAPSAIVTAGAGVGGQIGAELTDFVFILNNQAAVESFAQAGSITLGGNVSLAAGPLGRNAEAAGSASMKSVAAIFAYSKTKGLFAGISLEGSVLIERREANRKFYGSNCTAKMILSGRVDPPPECDPLFRVLESRVFRGARPSDFDDGDFYDDIPDNFSSSSGEYTPRSSARVRDEYDDYNNDDIYTSRRGGRDDNSSRTGSSFGGGARKGSSWQDDLYDSTPSSRSAGGRARSGSGSRRLDDDDGLYDRNNGGGRGGGSRGTQSRSNFKSTYSDHPGRPSAAKPRYGSSPSGGDSRHRRYDDDVDDFDRNDRSRDRDRGGSRAAPPPPVSEKVPLSRGGDEQAVALFTFEGEQEGDLSFRKGDVITILKRGESKDDWWTGLASGKRGIFPANYVELI